MRTPAHHGHHHNHSHGHGHSHYSLGTLIKSELLMHLPYAVFSVAVGMIVLSFLRYFAFTSPNPAAMARSSHMLFHSFHFLHLIFAATGTMITFFRFSKKMLLGIVIGTISPAFFCLLSDAILPYLGGRLLGVDMHFHICFISELHNVLPFLGIGILNGILLSGHHAEILTLFSISSHFIHIFVSSLASLFYLVSHGFDTWDQSMGFIFLFLIFAVVVPCTFSDFIVPVYFARGKK
jgi:hypothetical protein